MNREDQIIDYLNDELGKEEKNQFEKLLEKDEELKSLLEEYKLLYGAFRDQDLLQPETKILNIQKAKNGLEKKRQETQTKKYSRIISIIKYASVAAAAVLLLVIFQRRESLEIPISQTIIANSQKTKTNGRGDVQLANLLATGSVTNRISAIQQETETNQVNADVINILVETLQKDNSPNVRLATLEALEKYMHVDQVREVMIRRLSEEQDDFVMIALIQILSDYNDSDAIESFEKITQKEDAPKYIKDEAYLGLTKITVI